MNPETNMEKVKSVFVDSPFWKFMGFEIEKLEEGEACLRLEVISEPGRKYTPRSQALL
ncbi:hypothetical protein ACE1TI_19990 [Alteribacillus sp. JSM 102045]|uniref:hypothetical protein n=1 Tax=Alteribacillus sp. JSM 102045 TaxID=1562101 RepID=UPI0035BFAE8A